MGTYAEKIVKGYQSRRLSPDAIREQKNQRSKGRNENRRKKVREEADERNKEWAKLSPAQQISSLRGRRGKSKKQIKRIEEKLLT